MCTTCTTQTQRTPWERVIDFHGHICPGVLIGYRAAVYALQEFFEKRDVDEELVTVVENDSCSIDAIQVLTGCTAGKGNLIFKNVGKQAFTFVNRISNQAVRLVMHYGIFDALEDRNAIISFLQHAPIDEIFEIQDLENYELPSKAQIFKTVQCEVCGEGVMESKARLREGKIICLGCSEEYTRGW